LDGPGLILFRNSGISDKFEELVPVSEENLEGLVIIVSSLRLSGDVLIHEHLENVFVRIKILAGDSVVGQDVFKVLQTKN
jgi:hypothetical protein